MSRNENKTKHIPDEFAEIAHEDELTEENFVALFRALNNRESVIIPTVTNHGEPTDLDTPVEPRVVQEETDYTLGLLLD